MKRVLVDSEDKVVYEGKDARKLLEILNRDIYSVTEEEEVQFGEKLYIKYSGILKYEVHFDLKFIGLDDWYRPVFKDTETKLYFSDTSKLWTAQEAGENAKVLKEFYKENPDNLEYHGSTFDSEPHGGSNPIFKFNIIC